MKCFPLLLVASLILCSANALPQAYQNYANTHVTNSTGGPLGLFTITDSDGKKMARLFITGKGAAFDSGQNIVKGAGFIQAETDGYVDIRIAYRFKNEHEGAEPHRDMLRLRANRIEWDDDGNTTSVSGINPIAETMTQGKLKIASNVENPQLKDGLLSLDVEKLGKISVDIRFGYLGTIVGNPIFPAELRAPPAPLSVDKGTKNSQVNVWTDPATGLMWAGKDNGSDVNWNEAKDYCASLKLGGHSNWRLPSIDELQGIYDPAKGGGGWHIKGGIKLNSSSWGSTQNRSGEAWYFNFSSGKRHSDDLGSRDLLRALCVRRAGK